METAASNGLVSRPSAHAVDETVARLTAAIAARGATLFAVVDHSGEAARAGLSMPTTRLLIFGSPRAGTPLMLVRSGVAIDLPLKLLVHEDAQGGVWITYNSAAYLLARHGLPADLSKPLEVVEALAASAGAA